MEKIKYFFKEELWPHITYVYKNEPKKISSDFISRQSDLDLLLEEARSFYNSEIDRMKQVENKASIGLGITGILSTIITLLFGSLSVSNNCWFKAVCLICLFLFLLYCIGAIWYTIKVQERKLWNCVCVRFLLEQCKRIEIQSNRRLYECSILQPGYYKQKG